MRRTLAVWALLALAAFSTARAGDVELGLGSVDGRDSSGNGSSFAASWRAALGSGPWDGRVHLERVNDVGDSGAASGFDAYNVDLDLLVNSETYNRAVYYGGVGLGAVFADTTSTTYEAVLGSVGKCWHCNPSTPPTPAPPAPVTTLAVTTEDDQTYLRWSAVAGARLLFDDARTKGMVLELRYSGPAANIDVENTLGASAYLTFPVGK